MKGLVLLCLLPALAQNPRSPGDVGEPAPPLQIQEWLRGEPVPGLQAGTVYVLDFWAEWCNPCVSLMSHLSELQDRLGPRGVRVLGITGPDATGHSTWNARRILERKAGTVRFSVAWDAPVEAGGEYLDFHGKTTASYMRGVDADGGLPLAVVVDAAGRVAWVGHPAAVGPVLEAILAGRWDITAELARRRARSEAAPRFAKLRSLVAQRRLAEANVVARPLAEGAYADEPGALRLIAQLLASAAPEGGATTDLDLALQLARRADELTVHADITALITLARIRFLRGERDAAVAAQEEAVALAEPMQKAALLRDLARYRQR